MTPRWRKADSNRWSHLRQRCSLQRNYPCCNSDAGGRRRRAGAAVVLALKWDPSRALLKQPKAGASNRLTLPGNREFESGSLQRRVRCELTSPQSVSRSSSFLVRASRAGIRLAFRE
jgi:hypothetical protein